MFLFYMSAVTKGKAGAKVTPVAAKKGAAVAAKPAAKATGAKATGAKATGAKATGAKAAPKVVEAAPKKKLFGLF